MEVDGWDACEGGFSACGSAAAYHEVYVGYELGCEDGFGWGPDVG